MHSILVRPVVTEKSTKGTANSGNIEYTFIVKVGANKVEIGKAIEAAYNTPVRSINTMVYGARQKRRFTRTRVVEGTTSKFKKVVVRFAEPVEIDHFRGA